MTMADVMQSIRSAERQLASARDDLLREDKHPNDAHKVSVHLAAAAAHVTNAREAFQTKETQK